MGVQYCSTLIRKLESKNSEAKPATEAKSPKLLCLLEPHHPGSGTKEPQRWIGNQVENVVHSFALTIPQQDVNVPLASVVKNLVSVLCVDLVLASSLMDTSMI
jgi:hypothetical protein